MRTFEITIMKTVPSICQKKYNDMDIITDGNIEIDDEVKYPMLTQSGIMVNTVTVLEIIEQRPPRGDWSGKSYQHLTPIWNRVKVSN